MLEKKYISKKNWKRVIDREYVSCSITENQNDIGIASLIYIKDVSKPLLKVYKNIGKVKIADKGYYWLQIALKNTNFWITAMYNEKKRLIQYYIDITEKNVINSKEEAHFYYLFLDIVFSSSGKLILLDKDELINALSSKIINEKQYNLANSIANNILENIRLKKNELDNFCFKYLEKLSKKIDKNNQ